MLHIATDEWEVDSWQNDKLPTQTNTKLKRQKNKIKKCRLHGQYKSKDRLISHR